jgi:tRNA A-37 threonylcarbamoyl transferase component Bud32
MQRHNLLSFSCKDIRWSATCGDEGSEAPRKRRQKLNFRRWRSKNGERQTLKIFSYGDPRLHDVLTRLADPVFQKEYRIIKSERKTRVVRLTLEIGGTIKSLYIKQHNAITFAHRLASVVCASAAVRSLCGAATLLERGYATASPVAAVEYRRWGILIKSLYLSEEISGAKSVDNFWRDDLSALKGVDGHVNRRVFLRSLARLFSSLHEHGIYHNDLKAANILVVNTGAIIEPVFSLIDLQGLRKCWFVSRRRRIKNLAQLNRTLGVHLSRTEKLSFFKAYGESRWLDRRSTRELVKRIVDETTRQLFREKCRHGTVAHDLSEFRFNEHIGSHPDVRI